MSTFKGTKGLWVSTKIQTKKGSFYKVSGQISVCNITTRNEETAEANAKLIAAAPELLEALVELHSLLEDNLPSWYLKKHHNTAINIINKATE